MLARISILIFLAVGSYCPNPVSAQSDPIGAHDGAATKLKAIVDDDGVMIRQGDASVLYYQRKTKSLDGKWPRAGYVHPLFGLDGNVVTEDFPEDHRHHRGLFWAWHQVWVGDRMIGDPWICENFQWDVRQLNVTNTDSTCTVHANVEWKSPLYADSSGVSIPIANETTKITVHAAEPDFRLIDFEISVTALVDRLRIGGSDDVKGYGGFSPRVRLDDEMRFTAVGGVIEPTKTAIKAGQWVDLSGNAYGIAMIGHPDNPGPAGSFILRRKRSMQNAVYPGRTPVPVSQSEPTTLRYRIVIHRGDLDAEKIDSLARQFAGRQD